MRVSWLYCIFTMTVIGICLSPLQLWAQYVVPEGHDFECYNILTDTRIPEYEGLNRLDYGVATQDMGFSPDFDVTGQSVVLYTATSGVKIYEATPIVRFEKHTGRNLTAIWKSLRRGDLESGFPAFAASQVGYSWPGSAIVEKTVAGSTEYSLNANEVEIHISYDVKLPLWDWRKTPSKKQLKKWERYSCDVALHEKLHINPTRQYILEFANEIPSISAENINDFRYQLNLLWQKAQKSVSDENIRIDTVTNHGQRRLKK